MKKIEIKDIPFDLTFEGYYWYSNASKPVILDNKTITKDIFSQLPFIVEGNLYNKENAVSINIKNIDGQYWIMLANLADLNDTQISEQAYLAHDLAGIEKIKLLQYWQESPADELLEGMKTLVPAWLAFKGFVKN